MPYTKKRKRTYTPSPDISQKKIKTKCEHVRRRLNNMHNDYMFLNDLVITKNMDIDLYELKKKILLLNIFLDLIMQRIGIIK